MRILYMTQWFDPEPAFKGLSFAKRLIERGHDVRVVTAFPNYPKGKIYPGYQLRRFQRETMAGVVVDRLPLYPSHDQSALKRILNYLSFAVSLTLYGLANAGRYDAIYVYHPPVTAALAAAVVSFVRRRPFLVDIQDLWPDTLSATGMTKSYLILCLTDWACRFVYWRAARLIVQSCGFKRTLIKRGIPAKKIDVIINWAEEDYVSPRGAHDLAPYGFSGRFTVVFAGTLGLAQDLDLILDAAKCVLVDEPHILFLIVGDGVETNRLQSRISQEKIGNVRLMPRIARHEIADVLSAADVLLVTLRPDPLFEITIPSKTQFYLATGKPILMAIKGDAARLVTESRGGRAVEPGDPSALAAAAVELERLGPDELLKMGRRGAAFYTRELSFAVGIDKTLDVLKSIAS